MKKTLLFASAAVLLCGCGTGSKYVVEGHIAGLEGTVYMFEGDSLIDSAVVEGGNPWARQRRPVGSHRGRS